MPTITGLELVQMTRSARIAHRHLTGMKQAAMGDLLDKFCRATILEGATDATPQSYSRNPAGAFRELQAQYPSIDPSWFSDRNQGIYKQLQLGAIKVLKHEAGTDTAEEITQNLLGGIDPDGNKQSNPMMRSMGKFMSTSILNGSSDTGDAARKANAFAQKRATDAWRKSKRREKILNGPQIGVPNAEGMVFDVAEVNTRELTDVINEVLSSSKGRDFKNWIYKTVAESRSLDPLAKAVGYVYMKNNAKMSAGAIGKAPEVIAVNNGNPVSHTTVNNKFNLVVLAIREGIAKDPKAAQWVQDALTVRGVYASSMKTAKLTAMAGRVASRWFDRIA